MNSAKSRLPSSGDCLLLFAGFGVALAAFLVQTRGDMSNLYIAVGQQWRLNWTFICAALLAGPVMVGPFLARMHPAEQFTFCSGRTLWIVLAFTVYPVVLGMLFSFTQTGTAVWILYFFGFGSYVWGALWPLLTSFVLIRTLFHRQNADFVDWAGICLSLAWSTAFIFWLYLEFVVGIVE